MSKVLEFCELAKKNDKLKYAGMEYTSVLEDTQLMINNMYKDKIKAPDYYVTKKELCPDLETYNVHYPEDFETLKKALYNTYGPKEEVIEEQKESVRTLK